MGYELHGMTKTPEYNSWRSMVERCHSPAHQAFPNYGGRGIRVCTEWRESFLTFYEAMGPKPSREHLLERLNNDEGYSSTNCCWATRQEQARNKRNNHLLTHDGETKTLVEWAEKTGLCAGTILSRIRRDGLSVSEALTRSVDRGRRCSNNLLTLNGRTQSITNWANELGVLRATLSARLKAGWSVQRTLTVPVRQS